MWSNLGYEGYVWAKMPINGAIICALMAGKGLGLSAVQLPFSLSKKKKKKVTPAIKCNFPLIYYSATSLVN